MMLNVLHHPTKVKLPGRPSNDLALASGGNPVAAYFDGHMLMWRPVPAERLEKMKADGVEIRNVIVSIEGGHL